MQTQVKERPKSAGGYRSILVGYDGSENAKRALHRAISLVSASPGATLRILVGANTIIPVYGTPAPYYPPDYADEVVKQAKKTLTEALAQAKELGSRVSGSVKDGYASEVILDVANKEGIDLIILGRRGISGVQRFLMGSVSSSVVSHSTCDVLVVK